MPVWSPRRGWIRALGDRRWQALAAVWVGGQGAASGTWLQGEVFLDTPSRSQGTQTRSKLSEHERETEASRAGSAFRSLDSGFGIQVTALSGSGSL